MQWQSHFAAQTGLDVLWWSPHSTMFDLSTPLVIDYEHRQPRPRPKPGELRHAGYSEEFLIALVRSPPEDVEWLTGQMDRVAGRKTLQARSTPQTGVPVNILYELQSPTGRIRGFLLPRPVSSGAILAVDLEPGPLGGDAAIEFLVHLSYHHRGAPLRHRLRYRLLPATGQATRELRGPGEVLVEVPVPAGRSRLLLDLVRDAALMKDGTDNTITSIQMRLVSQNGVTASLGVFGVELSSRRPEPDHQLAQLRSFAAGYAKEYGHTQHVGVEFTSKEDELVHINAFLPGEALTGDLANGNHTTWNDPAEFVRRVHEADGVASFNHLFGTSVSQGPVVTQARRSRRRALELLENGAYGVEILEVGYTRRGGVGLEYHLRTWDILTARGLYLYGNGVSDSHGGGWGPRMMPNHFATWVWSRGPSAAELIDGMRRGRMVFGDPFSYSGRLFFRVGGAAMGDRVDVRQKRQPLRVGVDETFDPKQHQLYLVQGRIRPEVPRILYLTENEEGNKRPIDPGDEILINVRRPTFVRLELYSKDGRPLRFTNPIVFDRAPSG